MTDGWFCSSISEKETDRKRSQMRDGWMDGCISGSSTPVSPPGTVTVTKTTLSRRRRGRNRNDGWMVLFIKS